MAISNLDDVYVANPTAQSALNGEFDRVTQKALDHIAPDIQSMLADGADKDAIRSRIETHISNAYDESSRKTIQYARGEFNDEGKRVHVGDPRMDSSIRGESFDEVRGALDGFSSDIADVFADQIDLFNKDGQFDVDGYSDFVRDGMHSTIVVANQVAAYEAGKNIEQAQDAAIQTGDVAGLYNQGGAGKVFVQNSVDAASHDEIAALRESIAGTIGDDGKVDKDALKVALSDATYQTIGGVDGAMNELRQASAGERAYTDEQRQDIDTVIDRHMSDAQALADRVAEGGEVSDAELQRVLSMSTTASLGKLGTPESETEGTVKGAERGAENSAETGRGTSGPAGTKDAEAATDEVEKPSRLGAMKDSFVAALSPDENGKYGGGKQRASEVWNEYKQEKQEYEAQQEAQAAQDTDTKDVDTKGGLKTRGGQIAQLAPAAAAPATVKGDDVSNQVATSDNTQENTQNPQLASALADLKQALPGQGVAIPGVEQSDAKTDDGAELK